MSKKHSFPHHSGGPFGNDIDGPWMTPESFFRLLAFAGLGWKDIHASKVDAPNPSYVPQPQVHFSIKFEFFNVVCCILPAGSSNFSIKTVGNSFIDQPI
jgi:hypothetical protein